MGRRDLVTHRNVKRKKNVEQFSLYNFFVSFFKFNCVIFFTLFPLYHLRMLFRRFNDTFFLFFFNSLECAIPFSTQSFKHASVLKVFHNLRTVFVYILEDNMRTTAKLERKKKTKKKLDKSKPSKSGGRLLSPEQKKQQTRRIKEKNKDVALFGIPIAPETFCAQTLDKVIFISFHFIYCFY